MKNLKKAHEPYTPKPEATKYRFMCGSTKLVVTREGNLFYHEHPDGVTKKLIGDYKTLAHELRSRDASWITRDEGRHYPKTEKVFFDRTVAMSLLRQGYSVYCESLDTTIRFSEDYSHLIDLNCSMLPDLPASRFMRAFLEPCNVNSYEAVIAAKKEEADEIARLQKANAKLEAERAAEAKNFARQNEEACKDAERLEAENARLKAQAARLEAESIARQEKAAPEVTTSQKKNFNWKTFIGGLALGIVSVLGIERLTKNI